MTRDEALNQAEAIVARHDGYANPAHLALDIAEAIQAAAEEKWIPVRKREPDSARPVLCTHGGWPFQGWYSAPERRWFDYRGDYANVSHWMEMPAGPGRER